MALTPLSSLLDAAYAGGYAVGYFEAWDSYSLEAVAAAAEAERSPVVLGFGGMTVDPAWLDRFGIEPLAACAGSVAARLGVPAALILNEVPEWEQARRGVDAGFNVVMLDTCDLPFGRNVALTRELVRYAHPHGVQVQAELGRLPNFADGSHGEMTDPEQAGEFVEATDIDFLAVSVGNVHMRSRGAGGVDMARLRSIRRRVAVPLVIHGGSGLSKPAVATLIAAGVTLFHVGTVLKKRFWQAAEAAVAERAGNADYQALVGSRGTEDFLAPAKAVVTRAVRSLMRSYGSSGKAGAG